MTRLTKTEVDAIAPTDKEFIVWGDDPNGFGVKIFPSGTKTFVFQYRTQEGRTRRCKIGRYSETCTIEQARKKAKELANEVFNKGDPAGQGRARREAMTVNALFDLYLASAKFAEKAPSTQYVDRGRIERHVRPLLGSKTADMVKPEDVRRAQAAIAGGKTAGTTKTKARGVAKVTGGAGTADKAVLIIRAAYAWAISENYLKENPAATIKVAQSNQRDTIMDGAGDYESLFRTLARMEEELRIRPAAADAIRFVAFTGARKGEVEGMLRQYVDLSMGRVVFPPKAHKTGRKTGKPRTINLPAAAQAIIARQPTGEPTDFVFKAARGEGRISLGKPWRVVREEAKLPAILGLHGLRHSVASHLAMAGASSAELMESLGHRQVSTTMRYVHFAEQKKSELAERLASTALAGLADSLGKPKAQVAPPKGKTSE